MDALDQSYAETKDWDRTAQLGLSLELRLTNHRTVSLLTSSATHHWFCRIFIFIFELVKNWSDFRSSKLNL